MELSKNIENMKNIKDYKTKDLGSALVHAV